MPTGGQVKVVVLDARTQRHKLGSLRMRVPAGGTSWSGPVIELGKKP